MQFLHLSKFCKKKNNWRHWKGLNLMWHLHSSWSPQCPEVFPFEDGFHFEGMGESQLAWDQVIYMDGCSPCRDSSGSSSISWQSNVNLQMVEQTAKSSVSQIFLKNMNNHLWVNVQLILHKIWVIWWCFTTISLNFASFSASGLLGCCPLLGWRASHPSLNLLSYLKRQIWGRTSFP